MTGSSALGPYLDAAPCGFLSFGDDGIIAAVNATLLDMLGAPRDEVEGRHVESLLTVGGRIFYQTHFFPLLRLRGKAEEIFLVLRARDVEDIGVLVNAVRRERDGAWTTDCVLLRIRERRKFEEALLLAKREAEQARGIAEVRQRELAASQEQLQEQADELAVQTEEMEALNDELVLRARELERLRAVADEANQAKSTFLAMMSHELRTPLNAIGGYVQLLEMGIHGPVTEPQLEALQKVERSQRHLLRLVNEVLNLARIEAGHVEYEMERVRLVDVVGAVLPMVEPQLDAHRLRQEVRVPDGLAAHTDREKVEQILLNLLSNAVKFTPAGGRIRIEGDVHDEDPSLVRLQVIDTGIGIPAERLDNVFEPFVQVDTSHTRAEGSGLGLAISRDLARGMGGDLWASNAPGGGSIFTLVLPRDRTARTAADRE